MTQGYLFTTPDDRTTGHVTRTFAPLEPRECESCDRVFTPKNARVGAEQRYCSTRCRVAASKARRTEERPRFRQVGSLVCYWCHAALDKSLRDGYCCSACYWDALAATPKERARRREEARKAMGLMTAAENNAAQREAARWAALKALEARGGAGIVSDVRAWCAEREIELEWAKPWTGSLFQCDWFAATGRTLAAYHAGSSARKVTEWQLTGEAWRVLAELRGLGG